VTTLRAGSATDVGQIRSNNQDSHLVVVATDLYGVADGMGGHQGGEVASAMAVEIAEQHATEPTLESLKEAVRIANRAIFEKAGGDRDLHGMGTTLVAVQLVQGADGEEIAWVNVGDSRVYLLRDDMLTQLSADHSLVEDLVRDGQLTPDEAAVHPQRNILTRALGIDLDVEVDGNTVVPFTGDRYLLCSDGLFNEVSEDQMASVLRRLADPDEAAAELVRLANEGGGRDNITVVVVDVADDGGRAENASAVLADDPTRVVSAVPAAAAGRTVEAEDDALFAAQRSSLPDPGDDHGAESTDVFDNLDKARSRRFTWRVVAFLVLLLLVVGVVIGAIGWSASRTYYVGFDGEKVAVYRGKPGGVLWFDPKLDRTLAIARSDVPPAVRPDLVKGKEFGSSDEVDRYLRNLRDQIEGDQTDTSTTTSTAPASTTTTGVSATTTTAPPTTPPPTTAPPTTAAP
jgi:protein phosphatase